MLPIVGLVALLALAVLVLAVIKISNKTKQDAPQVSVPQRVRNMKPHPHRPSHAIAFPTIA